MNVVVVYSEIQNAHHELGDYCFPSCRTHKQGSWGG